MLVSNLGTGKESLLTNAVLGVKVDTSQVIVEFVPCQNHGFGEATLTTFSNAAAKSSGFIPLSVVGSVSTSGK